MAQRWKTHLLIQMNIRELKKWLKEQIEEIPPEYSDKVYDAATIEEGLQEVSKHGQRVAYERVLKLIE